jgi:hypothetical protein
VELARAKEIINQDLLPSEKFTDSEINTCITAMSEQNLIMEADGKLFLL